MRFKEFLKANLNEGFDVPTNVNFTNWVKPSEKNLKQEYDVEYQHHVKYDFGEVWPTYQDFKDGINKGKIINPNKFHVANTTDFDTIEGLFKLIKTYRSYPQFRNEKTFQGVIDGFKNNKPMNMPIIIKQGNNYQIMAGNTRLNIANILGVTPKAIVVEI